MNETSIDPYGLLLSMNDFQAPRITRSMDSIGDLIDMQDFDKYKLKYYKKNMKVKDYDLNRIISIDYVPNQPSPSSSLNTHEKDKVKNILKHFKNLSVNDKNGKFDRDSYKYRLKAKLNIDLKAIEAQTAKNVLDSRERSRRAYSEFSRKNKTQPIDVSNVKSSLKLDTFYRDFYKKARKTVNFCELTVPEEEEDEQNAEDVDYVKYPFIGSKSSFFNSSFYNDTRPHHNTPASALSPEKKRENNFFGVKKLRVNTLDNSFDYMETNVGSSAGTIRSSEVNSAGKMKYVYKPLFQNKFSYMFDETPLAVVDHNQTTHTDNDHQKPQKTTGGAETTKSVNFCFDTKPAPIVSLHERTNMSEPYEDAESVNDLRTKKNSKPMENETPPPSQANFTEFILKKEESSNGGDMAPALVLLGATKTDEMKFKSIKKPLFFDQGSNKTLSANRRQRMRVSDARDKVLNSKPSEKEHLNRLTVIQPFEDTKVLINIDKIPSEVLIDLLNNGNTVPSNYLIKPVKAFGYYTSKKFCDPPPTRVPSTAALSRNKNSRNVSRTL